MKSVKRYITLNEIEQIRKAACKIKGVNIRMEDTKPVAPLMIDGIIMFINKTMYNPRPKAMRDVIREFQEFKRIADSAIGEIKKDGNAKG